MAGHCQTGVKMKYQDIKLVESIFKEAPDDGNRGGQEPNRSTGLQAGPPYPQEDMDAVRALQTKLEDLGYSVGNTGIDGKYGPRTSRAVAAFKKDNNIADADNGRSMSSQDLSALDTAEKVETPSSTGNTAPAGSVSELPPGDIEEARTVIEQYIDREISDEELNYFIRAVAAEASPNARERGAVAAVILNRVNSSSYPNNIVAVLRQTNQFQAVTGVPGNRTASRWFRNMTSNTGQQVAAAIVHYLPQSNRSWLNFTSNNPQAYGRGTNIDFMYAMRQSPGAEVIGGTVFGTA